MRLLIPSLSHPGSSSFHFFSKSFFLFGHHIVTFLISMKAASMCFSIFQAPRRRINTLANVCCKRFDRSKPYEDIYTFRKLGALVCGIGGQNKRWTKRPITTGTGESSKCRTSSGKPKVRPGISNEIAASTKLSNRTDSQEEAQQVLCCDLKAQISKNKDLANLITFIVMDIETTGFKREVDRIIEIALQDLRGGPNSTFQTLVNPSRPVSNERIHGISTSMVNRPDVPRMEDLIPILLKYVRSRQKPGGHVVFVAHNGRTFDIPFLIHEFSRHSHDIPPNWLFLDTLPLAREVMKSARGSQPNQIKSNLQALREFYQIPSTGSAHRAMSDVHSLALIFQRLTYDLRLTTAHLVERTFEKSDLVDAAASKKKKKNSS